MNEVVERLTIPPPKKSEIAIEEVCRLEAIITIIILALAAASIGNGLKKVSQNRPGQGSNPSARPGQGGNPYSQAQRPTRPVRPNWQQTLPPELREVLGMDRPEQRGGEGAATEAAPSGEGTGYASEEGKSRGSQNSLYGGSLPPPEDNFATVSAVQRAEPTPAVMPALPEPAPRFSPEELRRAVVLSEVLKGPVALRRRGDIR